VLGINGAELVVIVVLALVLIGPEKLPHYAAQLGSLVRRGKELLTDAKGRVDEELGDELRDVDWQRLDPRQYDPRRIVKEALLDDSTPRTSRTGAGLSAGASTGARAGAAGPGVAAAAAGGSTIPAPYDDEAT
jgi:sec-independent protein translocase protein TatB